MKRRLPTDLARALFRFFQEYLPAQRGMSLHTIRSYRDAVVLFLRHAAQHQPAPQRVHARRSSPTTRPSRSSTMRASSSSFELSRVTTSQASRVGPLM